MVTSCGQDEPHRSAKNVYLSCVIGIYLCPYLMQYNPTRRGDALNPPPLKTCFGTILTRFFLHRKGWGIEITQEIFLKWVLRPRSTILCTFCLNYGPQSMAIAIFHQKYEKVLKTTRNVPKTDNNHQKQLVLGLGYQLQSFQPQKRPKNQISRYQMLQKPLFCHFTSPKCYDRHPHRFI